MLPPAREELELDPHPDAIGEGKFNLVFLIPIVIFFLLLFALLNNRKIRTALFSN